MADIQNLVASYFRNTLRSLTALPISESSFPTIMFFRGELSNDSEVQME